MRNAIVVVSFGTSVESAYLSGIKPVEDAIKEYYSESRVVTAFTSPRIRNKLLKRDGINIDSPESAIRKLICEGYSTIYIQPTLVIPGIEYDKLVSTVERISEQNPGLKIRIGRPLLTGDSDFVRIREIISCDNEGLDSDQILVYMGHGTEHAANETYNKIAGIMNDVCGRGCVTVVEGNPDFSEIASELASSGFKRAVLKPFMLVAGDHAMNDMASSDDDSLKSLLEAEGIACECIMQGLGASRIAADMYIDHIRDMMK